MFSYYILYYYDYLFSLFYHFVSNDLVNKDTIQYNNEPVFKGQPIGQITPFWQYYKYGYAAVIMGP